MAAPGAGRRERLRAGIVHFGPAFILGALAAAGQAPLGLWPLTLIALIGLFALFAPAAPSWRSAVLLWWAGAGHFAAAMFWIVEPFLVEPERHGWMAPFALVLMAGGMALFWGAAGYLAAKVTAGHGRALRIVAMALSLGLAELARGYVLTGLPWALLGHVWIDTPVLQAAAFVGPTGLTMLTLFLAALPVFAAGRAGRLAGLALAGGGLAGVWALGLVRLAAPLADPGDAAPMLRLVQPNAAQHLKWQPGLAETYFERLLALTARPPETALGRASDLVIWPETAIPWLLDNPGDALDLAVRSAGGARLALGIQRRDGRRFYNSLAVLAPDAGIEAVYDKFHLVPFGEYIPFGDLLADFGLTAFAAREGAGYSAGPGARVLDLGPLLGKAQPLICYEAVFAQDLASAPERPDWLLQVTNDGWFGEVAGPYQHLAQARLRAAERGLPMIRVANTGVTAVIDAKGRVLRSLPLGASGILDAPLPPPLPATLYARTGDWPALLLLLAGLALAAAVARLPRR